MKNFLAILFAALCFSTFSKLAHAQSALVIIVNNDLGIEKIPISHLGKIYAGKKKKWDSNKQPIQPCILDTSKYPVSNLFLKVILKTNDEKYKKFWLKKVFQGYSHPPITVSEDEAIKIVSENPNAIAFISRKKYKREHNNKSKWREISLF